VRIPKLAVAVVVLAACNFFNGIVGRDDLVEFAVAKSRWDARPFADYSYQIRTFCFCPPELTLWTRVRVVGGTVVGAEHVEPDPHTPLTTTQYFRPIDSLFTNLHRAMTESRFGSHYSAIIVEYDDDLGFPTNIEYRSKPNIADGGATIEVRNVLPLEYAFAVPAARGRR
jgi:hypothetical protein